MLKMLISKTQPWQKIIALFISIFFLLMQHAFGQGWVAYSSLSSHEPPQLVQAANHGSPLIFAVTKGDLFKSLNQGQSWERIFHAGGSEARINKIHVSEKNPNECYALTTHGLYQSIDTGKNWTKVFGGIGTNQSNVLSMAEHPLSNALYLGTSQGVLIRSNDGKTWAHAFPELSQERIVDMAVDSLNDEIYFATETKLYRYHFTEDLFNEVFTAAFSISESTDQDDAETEDVLETSAPFMRKIVVSNHPSLGLAAGTKNGVFASSDEGETWARLPVEGLRSTDITDIVYSNKIQTLFAATAKGIYQYDPNGQLWRELYEGLTNAKTFHLAIQSGKEEMLLAATEDGIFSSPIHVPVFRPEFQSVNLDIAGKTAQLFRLEPSVRDIQKKAVSYADVGNGKIQRWHAGSRFRALVPDLTFSKGLDVDNNIHVDTGSTTTPDIFVQGPDQRGRSTDINFSWKLADLIWNSSQTSIDSREKMMVELRDQILSEITRLYFERRRAQLDFLTNPPQNPAEQIKALMRIEELTANLDALTDGYLSKCLEKLYKQHPDLAEMWKAAEQTNLTMDH